MDIVTLAMAKAYTDSKQPLVVDLDKYGLGEILLYYYSQGGGAKGFEDNSEFWNEFKPVSDVILRMGYNGYEICMPVTNLIWYDNGTTCGGVSCSFTVVSDTMEIGTVNIAFSKYGSTTIVVVKVL